MSECACESREPPRGDDATRLIVEPLREWVCRSLKARQVSIHVRDRALGRCLPVFRGHCCRGDQIRDLEPSITALVEETMARGELCVIEPLSGHPALNPLALEGWERLVLFPVFGHQEPLGVVVIGDPDGELLATHREGLNIFASPTLWALRGLWEVRQATLENQELQREKRYLTALVGEIQQRQLMIEALTQEVEQTRAHLEAVLEHSPIGLISLDPAGVTQSVNAPATALLGCSRAPLGREFADLVPEAHRSLIETLLGRALAGEVAKALELLWPVGEETRTMTLELYPFRGDQREILGVVGALLDVTDEIRIRTEFSRSEKLVAMGEMIAGVAHEINNPLTSILGYSSILLRGAADPSLREPLEIIGREAERTARIVKNLLLYARQDHPERRPTNINELLDQVVRQRAEALSACRITVHRCFDDEIGPVDVDPFQLQQVFLNLIMNAEHTMAERQAEGHLILRTTLSPSSDRALIEVEDNGSGIPEKHLSRVFDPFFTTKEVGTGTGLGLSICYGIVNEHGGRISVRNAPTGGAIFTVELPLSAGDPHEEASEAPVASDWLSGKKILIVDDERHIRRFLQQALGSSGCQVEVAPNRNEALEMVIKNSFDLIIYDYKLPDGTGKDLARDILALDHTMADRMLLITGDSLAPETNAYVSRVPHVLMKPFDLPALQSALRTILAAQDTVEISR